MSFFNKNPGKTSKKQVFKLKTLFETRNNENPLEKGCKSQFSIGIFQTVKIETLNPPTDSIFGEQGDEIQGKIYEHKLAKCILFVMNSFTVELVYKSFI